MKRNICKQLTTCESLCELEPDHRGGSGTAKTSGMELFVAMVNSFYQWTIVTKISLSWMSRKSPLNTQGLMIRLLSFLQALFSE